MEWLIEHSSIMDENLLRNQTLNGQRLKEGFDTAPSSSAYADNNSL